MTTRTCVDMGRNVRRRGLGLMLAVRQAVESVAARMEQSPTVLEQALGSPILTSEMVEEMREMLERPCPPLGRSTEAACWDLLEDFHARDPSDTPTWVELRQLVEFGAHPLDILVLMERFGIEGSFEPTAQLRADDEGDDLGAETDAMLGMGEAEEWFREKMEGEP